MALLGGLSSTIFWPVTAALDASVGWRATLWIFGVIELGLVLPVNLWIASTWRDDEGPRLLEDDSPGGARPLADPGRRRSAAILMTVSFAAQGFASWGLPLHFITLFSTMGLDRASAVTIAALSGPASIAARGLELTLGRRLGPLTLTLTSMSLLCPSLALVLLPIPISTGSIAFVVLWSGANGILAVLRAILPLALLGARGYGTISGTMMLPQNLAFAASPTAFAMILDAGGPVAGLVTAFVACLLGLAAALPLVGLTRAERAATTRDEGDR
jgi:predicted MFS family arabinose efflux permease